MVEEPHKTNELDEDFDEELDPELLGLATSRRRGSILRPVLFVVVIWFGISIISDWHAQLAYFFSSSQPVEIGDVTEFASKRAQDPDWKPTIPHNRYVSLNGVPSKRAQSKRYRFFKLVGGQVYVEVPRADADDNELERKAKARAKAKDPTQVDRTYFEGAGRALRLSDVPRKYDGLRAYYASRYNTNFCDKHPPQEHTKAAETAGNECVDAYLIEAGVTPIDHWWYVALSALIGVFSLLNIWWLIRWVRDFMRS